MTMSADEARRSLAARVAERDLISTNMHVLYDSVGMKLLAGATLTGTTNTTWNDASAELAGMLEIFTAYSEVLDRATAMLGRTRRPAAAALAAVDAPCQLTAAADAVIRYQKAVRKFRSGEEEPDP
jgi:hypothetical protein